MATNASCSPARSIDSERIPASPSISARSSGSMPVSGSGKYQNDPSWRASAGRAARHGPSLRAVSMRTWAGMRSRASSTQPA
jgi:hypothetical protein